VRSVGVKGAAPGGGGAVAAGPWPLRNEEGGGQEKGSAVGGGLNGREARQIKLVRLKKKLRKVKGGGDWARKPPFKRLSHHAGGPINLKKAPMDKEWE